MKKLERLLEKLGEILSVEGMRTSEVIQTLFYLALMCLFEGVGIWIAVVANNYLFLSIITFLLIWMITECFVNKIFFEKIDNYLLETPKATILVFWIIFIITMILSWKYFVGFILSTILAFMLGDFKNNKKE